MILKKYKDFNEAFFKFNQYIFDDPDNIVDTQPAKYMVRDIRLEVSSLKCDKIDLGHLGYKKGKFRHLLSHYYNEERFNELKTIMAGNKKDTATYVCDNKLGGGCLQNITFSRLNGKEPWDMVTIHWKVVQLETKWAADLLYIYKIIEKLPNIKLNNIIMHFDKAFHNPLSIVFLCDAVFGCKFPKNNSKRNKDKKILALEKWRIPKVRYLNFASFARNQKAYKIFIGDEPNTLDKVLIGDLVL
jgi:hypothetical protein